MTAPQPSGEFYDVYRVAGRDPDLGGLRYALGLTITRTIECDRPALCHPEEPHVRHGFCRSCYEDVRRQLKTE